MLTQHQAIHTQTAKVAGVYFQHLGPLDKSPVLVFVGRDNVRRKSASLDALAARLHQLGITVCWYEHKAMQHASLREQALATVSHSWLNTYAERHPLAGSVARKLIKLYLKTKYPKRHGFFFKKIKLDAASTLSDLRRFLRNLKADQVFIMAQSAGGISASLIESEAAIQKLVCFGYPFKHPDRPEEAYRTAHLPFLTKPCLIIQGDQDEYGTAKDVARYPVSPSVQIASIHANHDYDGLTEAAFNEALNLMQSFLGLTGPDHSAST